MTDDKSRNAMTDKPQKLYPFHCPVCGVLMAELVFPDLTGWMRCRNRHTTVYKDGAPIRTEENGTPAGEAV